MKNKLKLTQALEVFREYHKSILLAYAIGYELACFSKHANGVAHAYDKLNGLLGDDFRKDMDIQDCMFLNSDIQMAISNTVKKACKEAKTSC